MSTFVIVPGAWDTPATAEPLLEPMESVGHKVIVVDLPCDDADATLEQYADAARTVLSAFEQRDFDGWAGIWVQAPHVRRVGHSFEEPLAWR